MDFFTILVMLVVTHIFWSWIFPWPKKSLKGQKCLITGAGSGIGRLMAFEFAKEGCDLALWDINKDAVDAVANEMKAMPLREGAQVFSYQCDVSQRENVYKVAEQVKSDLGKIDVVVNNAGIVSGHAVWDLKDEAIERVFKVNSLAPIWVTKAFVGDMIKENKGHFVMIASSAATCSPAKLADYCASKCAAFGFNEGLRQDLKANGYHGVKTTVVCPFYINTGMFDGVKTVGLYKMLEPKSVVDQIMHAVKTNKEELFLPFHVQIVYFVRPFLPTAVRDFIVDYLGIARSMANFKGQRRV